MPKSESIAALSGALAEAQKGYNPVKRTEHVGYDTKSGAKNYNYAPLDEVIDAVKEALSVNGLAFTQLTRRDGQDIMLDTFLIHSSGEWLSGEMLVGSVALTPQALGSALTYMRRYSLSAILGIASEEDDDAKEAEQSKKIPKPPPTEEMIGSDTTQHNRSEHFCEAHGVPFFKKGTMKGYAHKLSDGSWHNESLETGLKPLDASQERQGAAPAVEVGKQVTEAPPPEGKKAAKKRDMTKINEIQDLAQALLEDFGLSYAEQWKALNIRSWNEFSSLNMTPVRAYQHVASVRRRNEYRYSGNEPLEE